MQPTVQAYKEMQDAFDYFNAALFARYSKGNWR